MKKLIYSFVAFICLTLAACGSSVDYKALSQKAENNPASLTQQDYSDMIEYLDNVLDKAIKAKDGHALDNDAYAETFFTALFDGKLTAEGDGFGSGEYPALDASNKAKFEKLTNKTTELVKAVMQ
ncbi:MAG: hypothetical protein K2M19_01920 [Muribaculaceae bacterium]|nr:hypothetical protein [Muribaculaceae bacterium]